MKLEKNLTNRRDKKQINKEMHKKSIIQINAKQYLKQKEIKKKTSEKGQSILILMV